MLLASIAAASGSAGAQGTAKPPPTRQLAVWTAGSLHSRAYSRLPNPAYRDFYLLAVRRTWPLSASAKIALDYTVDLVPLAITTDVPEYHQSPSPLCTDGCLLPAPGPATTWHTALGFGAAPAGFQLRILPSRPVRGFVTAAGGVLWFTRRVPDPDATRFNFTAQIGGGTQIRLGPDRFVMLGYHFHHTSNAGTGRINPGLNSHMFYLGIGQERRQ